MSRFSHLEFDDHDEEDAQPAGRQEDTAAGADGLELAQTADVGTANEYIHRAHDAWQTGRFEPALQHYTRALQEDRSIIRAWVGQVQMLVELGEHDEARMWADKALELFRNNGDLLGAKAQACARMGDSHAATACSDVAMAQTGSSGGRWEARGEVLLAGRKGRPETCFEKALAEADADWFDRVIIGRIYLFYRQWANAAGYLQQALSLQPRSAFAWFTLGQCQDILGLEAQAQMSYRQAVEIAGKHPQAAAALAALESRSAWDRIRGAFRRILGR